MALQARLDAFRAEAGQPPSSVAACEWLADRVAAAGDTLGAVIGPDLVLAAWASLHGLAQFARERRAALGPRA